MGRWIGLDYGVRRIGVALADFRGIIASPATTLAATGRPADDAAAVLMWAAGHEPGGFVVGLPLNMDGTDSEQTRLTRAFAAELARQARPAPTGTPTPVELWDERLSSFQADAHLTAANVRKSRRKELRDALAAQVMLQSFLDARATEGG
ncbi:MAG: Holliday junction resolvase RuvX [Planctomycetota bacterium]